MEPMEQLAEKLDSTTKKRKFFFLPLSIFLILSLVTILVCIVWLFIDPSPILLLVLVSALFLCFVCVVAIEKLLRYFTAIEDKIIKEIYDQ